jgi:putative endonuclease
VAGLDPATHSVDGDTASCGKTLAAGSVSHNIAEMKGGWVYIMTNRPNGTLYVGATTNLARRAWEHRNGVADSFTKKYGLDRLVYAERHEDILTAKQRERNIKHWSRAWKIELILKDNPNWEDLYNGLA